MLVSTITNDGIADLDVAFGAIVIGRIRIGSDRTARNPKIDFRV